MKLLCDTTAILVSGRSINHLMNVLPLTQSSSFVSRVLGFHHVSSSVSIWEKSIAGNRVLYELTLDRLSQGCIPVCSRHHSFAMNRGAPTDEIAACFATPASSASIRVGFPPFVSSDNSPPPHTAAAVCIVRRRGDTTTSSTCGRMFFFITWSWSASACCQPNSVRAASSNSHDM